MFDSEIAIGLPSLQGLKIRTCRLPEVVELVESTKWADTLIGREIETLSRYLYVCDAPKGAVIIQEGGTDSYLCLVIKGIVRIAKQGTDHTSKNIGYADSGRIVGEMSLIDGEPRPASVIAEEDCVLVVLTGDSFSRLSEEVPRLAIKILMKVSKLISQRMRQTSGALVDYVDE